MSASSSFAYDQSADAFKAVTVVTLPPKPVKKAKAEKKPVEKKAPIPGVEAIPAPKVINDRFQGVGSCFASRLKNYITSNEGKTQLLDEAAAELKANKGIEFGYSVIATLHASQAPGTKPEDKQSLYDAYNATPAGKKILEEVRKKDQELNRISESILTNYVKSSSGLKYHERWENLRESKIIAKAVIYNLKILSQYISATVFNQLLSFRAKEIEAMVNRPSSIEVTTDTVRSFLSSKPPRGSFTLSCYIYETMARALRLEQFIEPVRLNPKEAKAAKEAAAKNPQAKPEQEDDGETPLNLVSMVAEIFTIVRKEVEKGWAERGTDAVTIRTTTTLKKLFSHVILEFCSKAILGIHKYVSARENNYTERGEGVKIDADDLRGRLHQMIFDSTNHEFEDHVRAAEDASLRKILDDLNSDFEQLDKFREEYNIVVAADKETKKARKDDENAAVITPDAVKEKRKAREDAAYEKELAKEASKKGMTVEAYKAQLAKNKAEREAAKEKRKALAEEELKARMKIREAKAADNEKKWTELIDRQKKILAEASKLPEVPTVTQLTIGGDSAATAPTPAA